MSLINLSSEDDFKTEILESKIPALVIFSATWCGPCKILKETLKEVVKDLEAANTIDNIKLVVLDVDESPKLATQYNIRSVPTIMLFNNKEKQEEVHGAIPKSSILQLINKYI